MKSTIQLKLKELIDVLEYKNKPLFDVVVTNYYKGEDNREINKFKGNSACIVVHENLKLQRMSIRHKAYTTTGSGVIVSIFKESEDDDLIEEKYEEAPVIIAKMIEDNPTLDSIVQDCVVDDIKWEMLQSDLVGVVFMSELFYTTKGSFKRT